MHKYICLQMSVCVLLANHFTYRIDKDHISRDKEGERKGRM